MLVPPNVPNFNIDVYCRHDCVDQLQNTTSAQQNGHITIFGSMFHTHLAGRQVFSKLMRNGREVDYLFQNKWFDQNYQYYSYLPKRVNVYKVSHPSFKVIIILESGGQRIVWEIDL